MINKDQSKKMWKRKMVAIVASAMIFATGTGNLSYVSACTANNEVYKDAYTIENILSGYQYFVNGDLTAGSSGESVGAVAVGGTLESDNAVGNAQTAPSYVNHLKKVSNFAESTWLSSTSYSSYKCTKFYYNTIDESFNAKWLVENKVISKKSSYIDFQQAFSSIELESQEFMKCSKEAYDFKDGTLTIRLRSGEDNYVSIPYSVISKATKIDITGMEMEEISEKKVVITITGVQENHLGLEYFSCINFNGKAFGTSMMDMKGGIQGGQLNLNGMKLVWNFPDAEGTITATGLCGHVVAPKAKVSLNCGGRFEGGVIAKVVDTNSEGHHYPFCKPGTKPDPTPSVVPTEEPKPTIVPTEEPKPTIIPTEEPKPTVVPTEAPKPTVVPTEEPKPTVVPTEAPKPTVVPTEEPKPTVVPTEAPKPTVVPTEEPKPTVVPTEEPKPTVAPTEDPTPTATPVAEIPTIDKEQIVEPFLPDVLINTPEKKEGVTKDNKKPNVAATTKEKKQVDSKETSPKTGEKSPIIPFAIVSIISVAGIGLCIKLKKKVD